MALLELAIDMGTSYTYIYQKGLGLVLKEPSVVAVKNNTNNKVIQAIGSEAKKLIGKNTEDISVVFPIFEGVIVSGNMATVMLEHFLKKIVPQTLFKPKIKALVTVPSGVNDKEKLLIESICINAGINEVMFVDSIIASALGVSAPMTVSRSCLVVDIGGGTTEMGAVNLSGVVAGCSLCVAGYNVDTSIMDCVAEYFGLKIGLSTAERLKIQIGSLLVNDNNITVVKGVDIMSGTQKQTQISSQDLRPTLATHYDKIFEVVEHLLSTLPGEISCDVYENGLYLCGGGSLMHGIDTLIKKRINIKICRIDDASSASIMGAGKLLANQNLYNNFYLPQQTHL